MSDSLNQIELKRYDRHVRLPGVGLAGQSKLKASRVLVVGAGGLGCPSLMYLAAAGVGFIGIVDDDLVDTSNLQRQLLHSERTVGQPKVASARTRLAEINPLIHIEARQVRLTEENVDALIAGYDVVIDGTDNFYARYVLNDACVRACIPQVYGSVLQFDGQVSVFGARGGPCYRCLFPVAPTGAFAPSCSEAGVFGMLPGVIGTIQAAEAIRLLLGIGHPLVGTLLVLDALTMQFSSLAIARDPNCVACGDTPRIEGFDYSVYCRSEGQPAVGLSATISPRELAELMEGAGSPLVIDVRERHEWALTSIAGARLIPLAELESACSTLDPLSAIIVYCKHGARSEAAAILLRSRGFADVRSLTGGIVAWADIDPSIVRY